MVLAQNYRTWMLYGFFRQATCYVSASILFMCDCCFSHTMMWDFCLDTVCNRFIYSAGGVSVLWTLFIINACKASMYFTWLIFSHAVRPSDFPRLEIVGCPVTYDLQSEKYEVKFQWRAPFFPSVLSHIDFFLIRVHEYLREDAPPVAIHANRPKRYVNVSFSAFHFWYNYLLCTIHFRTSITVFLTSQHRWTHLRI